MGLENTVTSMRLSFIAFRNLDLDREFCFGKYLSKKWN